MAIHYRCPKCQTADSAGDELAGTQIRCRQCGALLQLPGARPSHHVAEPGVIPPAPPPMPSAEARPERRREDEYDEYPRRRDLDREEDYGLGRGEPPAGWTTVRTGLGMMFWSLIAIIIEAVLLVIVMVAVIGIAFGPRAPGQFRRGDEGMAVLAIVGVCSIVITALIYFIGQCLCCAAPSHSGARGYALGSVICEVLIVLLYLLLVIVLAGAAAGGNPNPFMPGRIEGPMAAFTLLIIGLLYTAAILFTIFIKSVARYFGDEGLARGTNGFLVMVIVLGVLHGITGVLQFTMMAGPQFGGPGQNMAPIFIVFGCILGILFLAAFVWGLVLLAQTRGAIGRSLARPGY